MNVLMLMLSPGSANGGMEKHFSELANGLAASGVAITCMSAPEHLQPLEESVHRYPIKTGVSRYSVTLISTLVKALRSGKFDLVHAQGSKAAATLQRLSPFFPKIRFVATIHNFKSRYPDARRFSRILAVSHALAVDINHPKATVVYNGIHPFPAQDAALNNSLGPQPRWLAVGRLVHAKGFDLLIEAFSKAPGSLAIAGDGPDHSALQTQIDRLKLSGRVTLLGHRTDIPQLMASADAIVISSRREGFSYVCAEALLAGKPLISTNVPVANELLPSEHICPTNDVSGLSSLLKTPIAELEEAQAETRDVAARELTVQSMIEKTLRIYREVTLNAPGS